jgi:hypothetical protein
VLSTTPRAKHRSLGHQAGTLAILNLFLVGIWIASGSAYFWPAWVMLGSAVALAIKGLHLGLTRPDTA